MEYQITYPDGLEDDFRWSQTEAKGWLDGVVVTWPGGRRTLSLYDEVRLPQSIGVDMRRQGYFVVTALVVLPAVNRQEIERAVADMAAADFVELQL
jgi:hypothetical protein